MISKSIFILLLLSLLAALAVADICDAPQKQFYMSYNSIGNRDYLSVMFDQISQKLPKYNSSYTSENGSIYRILDLTPQLYYNQDRQTEKYHDQYTVNVTFGKLSIGFKFNFLMQHQKKNVSGWASGWDVLDQNSFLKKITIIDGALEWDPVQIPQIATSSYFYVQYSQPKFTQDQMNIYLQLLNDYLGTQHIKQNLIKQINILFPYALKHHLNHQDILKNSSILYTYNNISLNYTNYIKDFRLNNASTKGLEVFLQFGLEAGKQKCVSLPKQFDQASYGGIQQIISMGTIFNSVQQAARQGLFDVILDKTYQVPYFQFYMGDLANFVAYANKLPSRDPFTISCKFMFNKLIQLKVSKYDQQDIYVQVPEQCTLIYKQNPIIKITMDLYFIVRMNIAGDSFMPKIIQAGAQGDKYTSIDPNFVITDPYTAKQVVAAVLKKMIGKSVFGTGWKTINRKFPVIRVMQEYIVVFDPAQR